MKIDAEYYCILIFENIWHLPYVYYQSTSLSVSLFDCLFVCLFPNSSETANPSELKFWGMILFGIGKVLG